MKLIKYITLLFLCNQYALIGFSQSDETLGEVKKKLAVSSEEAQMWIYELTTFIREVQQDFSDIASHKTPFYRKREILNRTVERNFKNEYSIVQVTSFRRRNPREYQVRRYLQRLGNLSEGNYEEVELFFDKRYLKLGTINHIGGDKYEFMVSMYQGFKGTRLDGSVYKDSTKKNFRIIYYEEDGYWNFIIDDILAKEPTIITNNAMLALKEQWQPKEWD